MEKGMFIHPWDIGGDVERLMNHFSELNCNTIAVNVNYHHVGVADLRLGHMYYRREAGPGFSVKRDHYGRIQPLAQEHLEEQYHELRKLCSREGFSLKAWVVNSHNSTLGRKYPEACVVNAWGDICEHALCINNRYFKEYERNLLDDVERVAEPDAYIMEAAQWMPAFHGSHHEFMLGRLTPAIRYLLSLCFCDTCKEKASDWGIDGEAVQSLVNRLLGQLLTGDTTYGVNEETQLLHLFLEYPMLYEFQQFRMKSVLTLVKETAEQIHSFGKKYEYISSSTPFDLNTSYYEAGSFSGLEGVVDAFLPLIYNTESSYDKVWKNVRLFNNTTPVGMGINLGRAKYQNKQDFIERIREARRLNACEILSYNYGMATQEMLDWMREAYGE